MAKSRAGSTARSEAPTSSEIETSAVAMLKAVVSSLEHTGLVAGTEPRRLFIPDGIGLISLEVTIGTAKVALRIASDAKASPTLTPMALPSLMADSCRGSLLFSAGDHLNLGEEVPAKPETAVCGPITKRIKRTDPEFGKLVSNTNSNIVFEDEEGTGADRMMSVRMQEKLDALAAMVAAEWSDIKFRVTEA